MQNWKEHILEKKNVCRQLQVDEFYAITFSKNYSFYCDCKISMGHISIIRLIYLV
jgi:hypothetical protein